MAFDESQMLYRYSPNQRRDSGITSDWIVDRHDSDFPVFHEYEPQTSLMQMRHFIDQSSIASFYNAAPSNTATLPPFQSLDLTPCAIPSSNSWPFSMGSGLPSPPHSGPSSLYFSSCASDRQSTPVSPPHGSFLTWSPAMAHADHFDLAFGGEYHFTDERKHLVGHSCVALHDVQSYEDPQPEKMAYEDDTRYFGSYASAPQEGYEPAEPEGDYADSGVETDDNDSKDDEYIPQSPNLRRRRPQPVRSVTSAPKPSKVTKRSSHVRRSSAPQQKTSINSSNASTSSATVRAFPCALANYGCASTFGSKNEWKRHVNTQHMKLAYWRCDQCDSGKKPNDFNRKDLFIQHVRRMHPMQMITPSKKTAKLAKHAGNPAKGSAEDQAFNGLAERCFRQDRSPPSESGCHFCDTTFENIGKGEQGLWDKRLEHVAQHMESANKVELNTTDPNSWHTDALLERWLIENRIVVKAAAGGGCVLA